MNFLKALGNSRAVSGNLVPALRNRAQDIRTKQQHKMKMDMDAERLGILKRQNIEAEKEKARGDVKMPLESITRGVKYVSQGESLIEHARKHGYVEKTANGDEYITRRNFDAFKNVLKDPEFARGFGLRRVAEGRKKLREFEAAYAKKTEDGKVLTPEQNQKYKADKAALVSSLEQDVARSDVASRVKEQGIEQREIADKEKKTKISQQIADKKDTPKVPKPEKPKTLDDYNKLIINLQKAKLNAQTRKGLDEITLFMTQDNPAAIDAYKKGNNEPLVAELDEQIKYYTSERQKLLKPTKKEISIPTKTAASHGDRTKEAKAFLKKNNLIATPANIKHYLENY